MCLASKQSAVYHYVIQAVKPIRLPCIIDVVMQAIIVNTLEYPLSDTCGWFNAPPRDRKARSVTGVQ